MIYVLGGEGFVGSAFVRYAAEHRLPHEVIGRQSYDRYRGTACDILINANGNSRKYVADEDPALDFDLSVRSVMRSLVDFRPRTYVYISTVAVYEHPDNPAASHEATPIEPSRLTNYGFHKYVAESLVRRYHRSWLIVRLGGTVGPNMKKGPVYDLLAGQPLRVGHESRFQFIHTDIVAQAVFRLLDMGRENEVFNITGRGSIPMADVQRQLGREQPNDLPAETWDVDVAKAHSLLHLPTTEETIREFIQSGAARQSSGDR